MHLIPAIRDFFEYVNDLIYSLSNQIDLKLIFEASLRYFFVNIKSVFTSLITFQWLENIPYFPIYVPQLHSSLLRENLFLNKQISTFLSVLDRPAYTDQKLILGFLNSFFFSLPLSCAHLITLRRLLIQGIPAGIFSALGTITGQFLFATCILFGLRSLIIPWLSFDLNYFLCFFLLLKNLSDTIRIQRYKEIEINDKKRHLRIFLITLILSWTEQISTFQYFGNLTFSPEPTALEILNSKTQIQSYLLTSTYLYGFVVGTFLFTFVFGFLSIRLSRWIYDSLYWSFAQWYQRVNSGLISFTIGLTLYSFFYYSYEYFLTAPLGFTSQDQALYRTGFSLHTVRNPDKTTGFYNYNGYSQTINTEVASFDRAVYLDQPVNAYYPAFESLNFECHYSENHLYRVRKPTLLPPRVARRMRGTGRELALKVEHLTHPLNTMEQVVPNPILRRAEQERLSNLFDFYFYKEYHNLLKEEDSELRDLVDFDTRNKDEWDISRKDFNFRIRQFDETTLLDNMYIENGLFSVVTSSHKTDERIFYPLISELQEFCAQKRSFNSKYFKVPLFWHIHLFTLNQPTFQNLTFFQEKRLFEKRLILGSYYDSFRYYEHLLPGSEAFKACYNGSKSYANQIYGQKFKGTRKFVRRVFLLTPFLRERLPEKDKLELKSEKNKVELKFDQPLYLKGNERNYKFFHEEVSHKKVKSKKFKKMCSRKLLEISDTTPFYAAWDQELRKVVITNRFMSRFAAGYVLNSPKTNKSLTAVISKSKNRQSKSENRQSKSENRQSKSENRQSPQKKEYRTLANFLFSKEKIPFTKWPLSISQIRKEDQRVWGEVTRKQEYNKILPYTVQFDFVRPQEESVIIAGHLRDFLEPEISEVKKGNFLMFYPPLLSRVDGYRKLQTNIDLPTKGGYVWPGNLVLNKPLVRLIQKKYESIKEKCVSILKKRFPSLAPTLDKIFYPKPDHYEDSELIPHASDRFRKDYDSFIKKKSDFYIKKEDAKYALKDKIDEELESQ